MEKGERFLVYKVMLEKFNDKYPQYTFYCCSPQTDLTRNLNVYCSDLGIYHQNSIDRARCDNIMDNYCSTNLNESVCGCYEDPKGDPGNVGWLIYNYYKKNNPDLAVKSCLIPACNNAGAYKNSIEYDKKCPTFCGVVKQEYAQGNAVIIDNSVYKINCGNDQSPIVIETECAYNEHCDKKGKVGQVCNEDGKCVSCTDNIQCKDDSADCRHDSTKCKDLTPMCSNGKCSAQVGPKPDPDPKPDPKPDPTPKPDPKPPTPTPYNQKYIIALAVSIICLVIFMLLIK